MYFKRSAELKVVDPTVTVSSVEMESDRTRRTEAALSCDRDSGETVQRPS